MTIASEGDAGDLIFMLSIIQELTAGPHTLLIRPSTLTTLRTPKDICRFQRIMTSLVESQPYIKSFRIHSGEQIDWDSGGFRGMGLHYSGISLLECHAMHLASVMNGVGRNIRGTRQWLYVEPSMETKGMVVINRTSRYNNAFFPWKRVVEHYGGRIVFIGLKHEHESFCNQFGRVSWRETKDMLDMARLIAGSELFIGNQSSANALNEGLKHPVIQETYLHIPDCIFRRANAQHVADGHAIFPDVSGSGVMETPSQTTERYTFRTHKTPPDGWQYEGRKHMAWNSLLMDVKRLPEFQGKPEAEIALVVMEANWKRKPEFFLDEGFKHQFYTFKRAIETASIA